MQPFDPPQLLKALARILPDGASQQLCVAFSGGLDSSVLLHALALAPSPYRVRAIHIDHQLQADSGDWQRHCARMCSALGIQYQHCSVAVQIGVGVSIEAAARQARYAALGDALAAGETLLTAHHADDQLETVLLALLRGSGIRGLAAMPALQHLAQGWHARPLLEFTRAALQQWAKATGIHWVHDPTNEGRRFDRNYLRHEVLPALLQRWPAAASSVSRTAAHAAEAESLLEHLAQADAAQAVVQDGLRVSSLRVLSGPRRRNLVRHWLRQVGASPPSTRKLAGIEHDMLAAGEDRLPCVEWGVFAVRRYRDLLYCTARTLPLPGRPSPWDWSASLSLGALGAVRAYTSAGGGLAAARLPAQLTVAFRPDAAALLFADRTQQHKLKKLLQRANVLPWCRDCVPLVLNEGWLLAVGDWWVAEQFSAPPGAPGIRIEWYGAAVVRAAHS